MSSLSIADVYKTGITATLAISSRISNQWLNSVHYTSQRRMYTGHYGWLQYIYTYNVDAALADHAHNELELARFTGVGTCKVRTSSDMRGRMSITSLKSTPTQVFGPPLGPCWGCEVADLHICCYQLCLLVVHANDQSLTSVGIVQSDLSLLGMHQPNSLVNLLLGPYFKDS